MGLLLPAEGRIWPRGIYAGGQSTQCTLPGDGSGSFGYHGRVCAAEGPSETRNPRNAANTYAERRWAAIFYGYYQGVCHVSGVDDDQKCTALFEIRPGCLWVAHGVLHALLHRTVPVGSQDDMLRLLPVRSIIIVTVIPRPLFTEKQSSSNL